MVGRAVLIECLESPQVDKVLVINRNTLGMEHPKLKEIIHKDFFNYDSIKDQLAAYDACFYCLGVSAFGMSVADYAAITYDMTKALADTLYELNPKLVFNYVSGMGTDSTEAGRIMWARVKGKTENMVLNKGFKDAYAFRPGFIMPQKGVKSRTKLYNFFYVITKPIYPLLRNSKSITLSSNVGKAMINSVFIRQDKKQLENTDINKLANIDNHALAD